MVKLKTDNTKANLCDMCNQQSSFPDCLPDDIDEIEYGNGMGEDNIIKCPNYTED